MTLLPNDNDNNNNDNEFYYMPAEWAKHDACLMQLPHQEYIFRVPQARKQFLQIAKAIACEGKEPVIVFCADEKEAALAQNIIDKEILPCAHASIAAKDNRPAARIVTRVCPSWDSWARDMGPTFVLPRPHPATNDKNEDNNNNENEPQHQLLSRPVGIDWDFNGYGEMYPDYKQDQAVAGRMCKELNAMYDSSSQNVNHDAIVKSAVGTRKVDIILEGGSIHVDGEGTLLTTKECLLNPNRNPSKTQQELEAILCEHLGISKIIWLPNGVDGDVDTNGHVDNFACFLKPGHIILSWTDDEDNDSINYKRCREASSLLEHDTDAKGRSLTVHKLLLPPPVVCMNEKCSKLVNSLEPSFKSAHPSIDFVPFSVLFERDRKRFETLF